MLKKIAKCAGVATVIAAVIIASLWYMNRKPQWPGFADQAGDAPQYVITYERDFGYRTGSIVPVSIAFKVPKGTTLDVDSQMQSEGDMVVASRKIVAEQFSADGNQYVRMNLKFQAFVWKEKWTNKLSFVYRTAGSPELKVLELENITVSTSKTYDGDTKDKHPKEPDLKVIEGYHLVWTLLGLVGGFAGMVGCVVYLVRTRKPRPPRKPKPPKPVPPPPPPKPVDPWDAFKASVSRVLKGDHSREALELVVTAARNYTGFPIATATELSDSSDERQKSLGTLLKVCESVVWGGSTLTTAQRDAIGDSLYALRPFPADEA